LNLNILLIYNKDIINIIRVFMSILTSLFSSKPKILTSTPPKELQPAISPESALKISTLRALLTSKEARCLSSVEMSMHFKDRIVELDLQDDYLTAFYACKANPEAIVLFSDEIKDKFLKKCSIFSYLKKARPPIEDASTLSAASSRSSLFLDDESTLTGPRSGQQSPTGSDDSSGSGISVYSTGSLLELEERRHAETIGASLAPKTSIKENQCLAIVPYIHRPTDEELMAKEQKKFMERSLKVYVASQQLLRHLHATSKQEKTPEVSHSAKSVKIPQRLNVHPTILATPKFLEATQVASHNPLLELQKTARQAVEFVLRLSVIESFPAELRQAVEKVFVKPDAALSLMIQHVHKIESKDLVKWSKTIASHISSMDEIKEIKAVYSMKQAFCANFSRDKTMLAYSQSFINTPFAESILKACYQRKLSSHDAFSRLNDTFSSEIATHSFVISFHPTQRRYALEFTRSPETRQLLQDLKLRHASIKQTTDALRHEFNCARTIATFINQFRGEIRAEAVILAESKLLDKVVKEAMRQGLDFRKTLHVLNMFFNFSCSEVGYLNQFKEPALEKALETLKEEATISKLVTLIRLGIKDDEVRTTLDAYIKSKVNDKLTPSLAEMFPDIAPLFKHRAPLKPKPEVNLSSMIKTLEKKMAEKVAQEVMEAACKALATNDGSHLAKYTTKDLEALPAPLKALVMSKGFDITDWDEL
jgi:hypothetical protein